MHGQPKCALEELFRTVTGMVYSLAYVSVQMTRRYTWSTFSHMRRFSFLPSALMTLVRRQERASVRMEEWGEKSPPSGGFLHCARNLNIDCRGLPESDFHYDLVKQVRKRVKDGAMDCLSAFEVLSLAIGWRNASNVVRLLWHEEYDGYCAYEAALMAAERGQDEHRRTGNCRKAGILLTLRHPVCQDRLPAH